MTRARILRVVAPLLLLLLSPARSFADELIFSRQIDGQANYGPSSHAPGGPVNAEVADDFNLSASVERIVAYGFLWGPTNDFSGVYVRFYAFGDDGKPGLLQSESFLAADDPNLINGLDPFGDFVDITLPAPFPATGQHFVTVQPVLTTSWYRWSSNTGAPHGSPFYFRDPGSGIPAWQQGDGLPRCSTRTRSAPPRRRSHRERSTTSR